MSNSGRPAGRSAVGPYLASAFSCSAFTRDSNSAMTAGLLAIVRTGVVPVQDDRNGVLFRQQRGRGLRRLLFLAVVLDRCVTRDGSKAVLDGLRRRVTRRRCWGRIEFLGQVLDRRATGREQSVERRAADDPGLYVGNRGDDVWGRVLTIFEDNHLARRHEAVRALQPSFGARGLGLFDGIVDDTGDDPCRAGWCEVVVAVFRKDGCVIGLHVHSLDGTASGEQSRHLASQPCGLAPMVCFLPRQRPCCDFSESKWRRLYSLHADHYIRRTG